MSATADPPDAPDAPQVVTAVPELSAGTHFPCLDAYRGIGMTMVLMNHAAYATAFVRPDTTLGRTIGPLIARFDLSVPMFFVMSGFLLYRPFVKATMQERSPLAIRTFYRRRALRVFPAYWTALVLLGLIFGLQIASWKGWIGNALVLPAFGVPVQVCNDAGACHVAYGITQAWSIGVEVTFYLLLPLYAMLISRLCRGRALKAQVLVLLGGLAVLYLASTGFRAYVVLASPSWAEQSLLWLPMFLDLFAIGMALAVLSAALSEGRALPRALAWFGDHPNVCWIIAGLIFFGVTRMRYPDRPFGLHDSSGYSDYLPRQFLYGLASAIWLFPAMFGDQSKGMLRRILSSRPLVFLGAVSLSFYLWHLNIIDQVKAWTVPDWAEKVERAAHPRPGNQLDGLATFTGNYWLVVVLSFVLSLAIASVLFYVVELPFLKLKDQPLRALFKRRRPAGPST